MKNHVQIYIPKCPRTYENHLLNLLESSIPDISSSMLTIFSIGTLEKVVSNYVMASTQKSVEDFPVSENRLIIFILFHLISSFPAKFLFRNVAFTPRKKVSALCKFKIVMKQPALASFHFKNSSNDQDKPSTSTSGENTDTCSPLIPDAHGPQKTM